METTWSSTSVEGRAPPAGSGVSRVRTGARGEPRNSWDPGTPVLVRAALHGMSQLADLLPAAGADSTAMDSHYRSVFEAA